MKNVMAFMIRPSLQQDVSVKRIYVIMNVTLPKFA